MKRRFRFHLTEGYPQQHWSTQLQDFDDDSLEEIEGTGGLEKTLGELGLSHLGSMNQKRVGKE